MALAPTWLALVLGVVLIAAGAYLMARPLTALSVLGVYVGVSCVLSGVAAPTGLVHESPQDRGQPSSISIGSAAVWIVVGVAIVVWIGQDVDLFGPLVAIMLIFSGVVAWSV